MNELKKIKDYLSFNYTHIGTIHNVIMGNKNINSTNYIVSSKNGSYILKKFTDGSTPSQIEKMCKILLFCKKKKVKVSEPIKNKTGHFVDKKNNMYLSKYQKGKSYNRTLVEIRDVAKNLAILHKALALNSVNYNFKTNQIFYKILNHNEYQKILKIIKNIKNKNLFDKKVLKNIQLLIDYSKIDERISKDLKSNTSKQLVHYDLHPGNVIFKNNHVLSILDFHSMHFGNKIDDVAFAAFRFSFSKSKTSLEILKQVKFFLNTYLKYNSLNKKQLLYFNYFFIHEVLSRLSYILRKRYFHNSDSWTKDFDKFIIYLKLCKRFEKLE